MKMRLIIFFSRNDQMLFFGGVIPKFGLDPTFYSHSLDLDNLHFKKWKFAFSIIDFDSLILYIWMRGEDAKKCNNPKKFYTSEKWLCLSEIGFLKKLVSTLVFNFLKWSWFLELHLLKKNYQILINLTWCDHK